jgi:hypothetical protein
MEFPQDISKWRELEVYAMDFRPDLLDMANTVTRLNLWDWFKNESPPIGKGYMSWGHPNIDMISNGLKSNDHSGATFAWCMQCMRGIALKGFEKWNSI